MMIDDDPRVKGIENTAVFFHVAKKCGVLCNPDESSATGLSLALTRPLLALQDPAPLVHSFFFSSIFSA